MASKREYGGEPIPGYKLMERLGGGGFGEVWKVEAPGGIHKALKFVYGDLQTTNEEGQRAEQELKALNRVKTVRHPYILSLERYDIIDGQLMIIMELADKNLWDRFRECKVQGLQGIPREELLGYMEESAEALDLMNIQYQLQHLDIKPQNIFLVYNHIKVADFGLVKDLEGMVASVTGGVTPVYAAPETFDGMVTRFCDQYSLAIVYQELLTGQRPFVGTNIHQLVMQHVQGKPNLASLPPAEQEVIGRALSKNPDDRYPNCMDMVRALRAAGEKGTAVVAPPAPVAPSPADAARVVSVEKSPLTEGPVTVPPIRQAALEPVVLEAPPPVAPPPPPLPPREEPLKRREAPAEVTGDGDLVPALVIGLGQLGLAVLQQFRESLKDNFVSADVLPNIRWLGIDTDPEALHGMPAARGAPLAASDLLQARLNRAIHYMKPRDGRPKIDTWFNTNMLYRIQRNLTTGGLRALGRLAFIDNYRSIMQRIRGDLDACLEPANMTTASKNTGLKLRSNRPRIYVVTGLGGGTGSGMFIDLAYVLREQLKQFGYDKPEVIGVFLLPAVDRKSVGSKAVVNAYAALTELNHFSSKGVIFSAKFDEREPAVTDPNPPFTRSILLPVGADDVAVAKAAALAGDYLCRELTTALGKAADQGRAALPAPANPSDFLACQTFGMSRFWWPRRTLLQRVARRYCQFLVQRWVAKEVKGAQSIDGYVKEQWEKKELGADVQITRLQGACERALGKAPEVVFSTITEPFVSKGWFGNVTLNLRAETVREAVDKIEKTIGQPTSSSVLHKPGLLEETLRKEGESLADEWDKKLLQETGALIERPEFRLAGAEQAIRAYLNQVEQTLKHHEPLCLEFTQNATAGNERLQFLLQNVEEIITGGRRTAPFASELVEILKTYPKMRYQSMMLKLLNNTLTAVRGKLSDQLREIGYCRTRLSELLKAFDNVPKDAADQAPGFQLLPVGCRTIDEAVDAMVQDTQPEDLDELDKRMHNLIRQQFRGFSNIVNSPTSILKNLENAMLEEAATFTLSRLTGFDIVEMYLSRFEDDADAKRPLAKAFDDAAPELLGPDASSRTEVCVLAVPPVPQEERFRAIAGDAIPDAEMLPASAIDDILIYREEARLPLDKLDIVSPAGHEAYQQANFTENFTTHTRTDIFDWRGFHK